MCSIIITKKFQIKDKENRQFSFNVDRNRESTIQAFCDLLLLSRTDIIKMSDSSFLKISQLYSNLERLT